MSIQEILTNKIFFYNRTTGRLQQFEPIKANNIRMYVCGPTVYDDIHIGNARPLVVFDVLFRFFRLCYGEQNVTYVRNITDIDDKIIARAASLGIPCEALTEKTIEAFHKICSTLQCLPPSIQPKATEHINSMLAIIAKLLDRGFAYQAEGHVLFDVSKKSDYGLFAKKPLEDLIAGARVDVAPYKKSPLDFVLWKPAKPHEPCWDSPYGKGRPGWHIECSAMAKQHLGDDFDLHAGGQDLIFPHHENELAQSLCAHPNTHFARYWLHNGYLLIQGKKMSKSLGNFITVQQLLEKKIKPEILRLILLATHYRQPLDFTDDKINEMNQVYQRIKIAINDKYFISVPITMQQNLNINKKLIEELGQDLNTPQFLTELYHNIKQFHKNPTTSLVYEITARLKLLGLGNLLNEKSVTNQYSEKLQQLLQTRKIAKQAKDYNKADAIRKEIENLGFIVKDEPDGNCQLISK